MKTRDLLGALASYPPDLPVVSLIGAPVAAVHLDLAVVELEESGPQWDGYHLLSDYASTSTPSWAEASAWWDRWARGPTGLPVCQPELVVVISSAPESARYRLPRRALVECPLPAERSIPVVAWLSVYDAALLLKGAPPSTHRTKARQASYLSRRAGDVLNRYALRAAEEGV